MRSLRKFLFRNETVAVMLIFQAIIDGFIIVAVIGILKEFGYVQLNHGAETIALIHWGFLSSWMLAILVVSFIYGISIINRVIFYKQLGLAIFFYAIIQIMLFGVGKVTLLSTYNILIIFFTTSFSILLYRTLLFAGYKFFSLLNREKAFIIIGCNIKAEMLEKSLRKDRSRNAQFLGFFDKYNPDRDYFKQHFKGYLEDVKTFCLQHNVQAVYYTLPTDREYLNDLTEFTDRNFIFFGIVPDLDVHNRRKVDTMYLEDVDLPIISYRCSPLQREINSHVKRAFDILFSAAALLVLVPLVLPVIAWLIKLDSAGPIFFVQKRPGRNNRLFDCYKFRTMVFNNSTEVQATKNDKRVTRVGAFLRKTSLDELPQFFNVLKGDMSIVGPRPNLVSHLNQYGVQFPEYSRRHIITPGITGFAQVSGYRGEIKEHGNMEKRLAYDLEYMEKWSLAMDVKIIFKTVGQVFLGDEKAY